MDFRLPRYKELDRKWVADQLQERTKGTVSFEILVFCIDEVCQDICNYINRLYVPEPLKYVVCNLTMDLITSRAKAGEIENAEISQGPDFAITKLKDGDSEVTFSTSANNGTHKANVDDFLYNYKEQLDKFRTLRW